MGADITKSSRSDIIPESIQFKELSPNAIIKFRSDLLENSSKIRIDNSRLISMLGIGQRESDILFEYFDMNGDGEI